MNSYLLLENGVTYNCTVTTEPKNILGSLIQTEAGVTIRCATTGENISISSDAGTYQLSPSSMDELLYHIKNGIKAKLITDALPIEYHLYDLKSNFS